MTRRILLLILASLATFISYSQTTVYIVGSPIEYKEPPKDYLIWDEFYESWNAVGRKQFTSLDSQCRNNEVYFDYTLPDEYALDIGSYNLVDMYPDYFEVNTKMYLKYDPKGYSTDYVIRANNREQGRISVRDDMGTHFTAKISASLYFGDTYLGEVNYYFDTDFDNGKSSNAVVRVNRRTHGNAVNGITGGSREKQEQLLKRIHLKAIKIEKMEQSIPRQVHTYANSLCTKQKSFWEEN